MHTLDSRSGTFNVSTEDIALRYVEILTGMTQCN